MNADLLSTLTRRVLFAPLHAHGRADLVAERLRTAIALGVLAESEQLPSETDLAAQFNVSPVTLREALAQLRELGLVTTWRGRGGGTVVSASLPSQRPAAIEQAGALSSLDLRDLADWRRAIGTESARLAARRASSQDILLLERGSGNLAAAHDEVEARRSDSRFFIELAAAAQSFRLSSSSITLQVEYAPVLTIVYADAAVRSTVSDVLAGVTDAVRAADVERAGRLAAKAVDLVAAQAAQLRANGWDS